MTSAQPHGEQHPLAAFKPRAVVDWVILRFTTPRPTQPRHLRDRMPSEWRTFAKAIGDDENSCRDWLLTIQDPPAAHAIARVLGAQGIDPSNAKIEAIEVAIDWYPRTPEARTKLADTALHLARHLARPPSGTPRITEPGRYRAAARPNDTLRALSDGYTVNTGAKDAEHRARHYVKRNDSGQAGAYEDLPEREHRARTEVTLSGNACPIKTLDELASWKFETLAKHFHQRKTTTPKTQLAALLQGEVHQWGRPADEKKRSDHRRQNHLATRGDNTANNWIYNALRGLTRASKNAGIPAFAAPHNGLSPQRNAREAGARPKYLKGKDKNQEPVNEKVSDTSQAHLAPLMKQGRSSEALAE